MNVTTVEYSVRSLSSVHNVSVCLSENFLICPWIFTKSLWSQMNDPASASVYSVCVVVRMVIWHKDKAWCLKWGVAAMHVCCSPFKHWFKQPSAEEKSNWFWWSSLTTVNTIHWNCLCYAEHSVLRKMAWKCRSEREWECPKTNSNSSP